jgi:hypothetical protein
MGISRRKAGMAVQCPGCRNQVTVPPAEGEPVPAAGAPPPPPLFEREDFDDFLNNAGVSSVGHPPPPAPPPMPRPAPYTHAPAASSVALAAAPPPAGGIVVSPTLATIVTVGLIILLAIAFGAGLLVGRFYLGG